MSWDHYYGPAPASAIESGLSDLAEDIGAEIKSKEDPQGQDEETTTFINEILNNEEKLDSLDSKDDDIDNYLDESNDEDIFGC